MPVDTSGGGGGGSSYQDYAVRRRRTTTGNRYRSPYTPPPKTQYTPQYMPTAQPGPTAGGGQYQSVGTPPRPAVPAARDFLKRDTGYQQAIREFKLNWQNFLADQGRQKTTAREQYKTQRGQLQEQRTRDLRDIESDFASRGLLQSGLYAGRLGEYEKDFTTNMTSYRSAYDDFLRQLSQAYQQMQSQQRLEQERARQEALARRASQYGL